MSEVAAQDRQISDGKQNKPVRAHHQISMRAVVTGGGGYCGYKLGCALANIGASVVLCDIHKPLWMIPNGVVWIQV